MPAHGGGEACAKLRVVPRCDACRVSHARRARHSNSRYKATAKGVLAVLRSHRKDRRRS